MIPLPLRDLWTISRLQGQGVRLDMKGVLLRPASPLMQATARSLPGFGIWTGRVRTVVVREAGGAGFVQARWRTGAPAMDLVFISPSLRARQGATWLWQRLLNELGRVGAEQGCQRLFVHLPEQSHAEVEVMRQSGFAIYSQDRLYRLDALPAFAPEAEALWKRREPIDDWGLMRLYLAVTPSVVQQAENMVAEPHEGSGYAGWLSNSRANSFVLRGSTAGDVMAYLRLTRGSQAHWLKLVVHPEWAHHGARLLEQGLSLMARWPRRPIFCDVRDYEGFVTDALARCSFERVMARMLLVRHTTASVRIKAARPIPALEAAPETAPTPF